MLNVHVGPRLRPLPRSYLGLSLEYWGMPLFVERLRPLTRILRDLTVPRSGPLVLRIGGDSADRSLWDPGGRPLPQGEFRLSSSWLHAARRLLRRLPRLRLVLDLNLITASPLRAMAFARAAWAQLPHRRIAGFEIGNEPDIYDRPYWQATIAHLAQGPAVLPAAITARDYLRDFLAYARALRTFAPGVPLIGPAVATPQRSLGWIALLARRGRPYLGALSAHRYPLSACLGPGSSNAPTIGRLLSARATAGLAHAVRRAVAVARRAGLPLRMTELNSVTCGGREGVSNSFATALWAPDALFELLRAGVDGVDIHVRATAPNAAMVPAGTGLSARPLLYGMMLFTRTLAPGGSLAAVTAEPYRPAGVKLWAIRTPGGGERVLAENKGRRVIRLRLSQLTGRVAIERLLAPGAGATQGERLAGQWLGHDGRWHGRRRTERLGPDRHGGVVALPPLSATLIVADPSSGRVHRRRL
jgi:hypothetical protein